MGQVSLTALETDGFGFEEEPSHPRGCLALANLLSE